MASKQVVDVEKLNDWDLTNDELNVLDILYWVAMYPDRNEDDAAASMGKSVSMSELFKSGPFKQRMKLVMPKIKSEMGDISKPTYLYQYERLWFEKVSSNNPITSILNHLGNSDYIELDKKKMTTNNADKLIDKVKDTNGSYDFKKVYQDDQANVYIMIRRKGIIAAEKNNREKVNHSIRLQEQRDAKAQADSSKSLEKIVACFGGFSVLVAVADWDWSTSGIIDNVFRFIVMGLIITAVYFYDKKTNFIRKHFGEKKDQ